MSSLLNKFFLASFFVRLGLGSVFLIFGLGKFFGDIWAVTIPSLPVIRSLPVAGETVVLIVGIVEVLIGLLLIVGFWTRWVALIASLELVMILLLLRFQEVRDVGLLLCALSLVFTGSNFLSLDKHFFGNEAS